MWSYDDSIIERIETQRLHAYQEQMWDEYIALTELKLVNDENWGAEHEPRDYPTPARDVDDYESSDYEELYIRTARMGRLIAAAPFLHTLGHYE